MIAPELLAENVTRQLEEADGFWVSCSGCHESIDGASTSPMDPVFKCHRGGGCSECGGIGAIWDTTDYEEMARFIIAEDAKNAEPESARHAQQTWQPIATAPKDGTDILLCDARLMNLRMVASWEQDDHDFPWTTLDGSYHAERFTHWQPLPAPPVVPDDGQARGTRS